MILDRAHYPWAAFTALTTGALSFHYLRFSPGSGTGPTSGSLQGICYGVGGFLLILAAAALPLRRMVPAWRIGSARVWLMAHIWLGLLSVPFILFHGTFRMGGHLTTFLMVIFGLVIVSGMVGFLIQQILPQRMTLAVPLETVHDRIPAIQKDLAEEARLRVDRLCESLGPESDEAKSVVAFYQECIVQVMGGAPGAQALDRWQIETRLESVKANVPPEHHATLHILALLCDEQRQLEHQQFLHLVLHGWLMFHKPLTFVLVVASFVHAAWSLQY